MCPDEVYIECLKNYKERDSLNDLKPWHNGKSMVGMVFGIYTILDKAKEYRDKHGILKNICWLVRCKCGNILWAYRNRVLGQKTLFCKSCYGLGNRGNKSVHWRGKGGVPYSVLSKIRCTLNRGRTIPCDLSIQDLEDVWVKQEGRCALTGRYLVFPDVLYKDTKSGTASVDRIDSGLGYTKSNIQFVHKDINNMKQGHNQAYFMELCKEVVSWEK